MLLWTVGLGAAANVLAGYLMHHRPALDRRVEMPRFEVAANIQRYLGNYRNCPTVILGSSIVGDVPPAGWERPGVCTMALVGEGAFLGLEIMARTPAAPRTLLIESSFAFRDAPAHEVAAATDPLRAALHDWFPLATAHGNWVNLLEIAQYPVPRELYRPAEPLEQWRVEREPYSDIIVEVYGGPLSDWSRKHLGENRARIGELVATMERRGTKVIFFDAPMEPRLAVLPVIALWTDLMHEAFADHEWIESSSDRYYLSDGMHFTSGSGEDFFDLLMAHVPGETAAPAEAGTAGK